MSAVEHRCIARLPLEVFADLQHHKKDFHQPYGEPSSNEDTCLSCTTTPEDLRREIATKLKAAKIRKYRDNSNTAASSILQHQRPLYPMQQQQQQQKYYYESITTVGSMLQLSPIALLRALDPLLTFQECHEFHRRVCLATAPKPVSALTLLQRQNQNQQHFILPTGLRKLDTHLRGGFRVGTLTEVVGCAGAAKTQLALQMACYCRASTIFVDTESKVSLQRLQEMAGSSHILSNVSVHSPTNMEELLHVLGKLEDEILNHTETKCLPVKLLVIDSIAAPARRHGFGSAAVQAATVLRIAQTVKRLADQFQLVALVINQVASSSSSTEQTKAALGTAWHHCVSTRVQLEMSTDPQGAIVARHATVVKSNMVGGSSPLEFKVTTQGLVDV